MTTSAVAALLKASSTVSPSVKLPAEIGELQIHSLTPFPRSFFILNLCHYSQRPLTNMTKRWYKAELCRDILRT